MSHSTLKVGFARVDVSPQESVPLHGYGNTHTRMSQGVLDPLTATCIAFQDDRGSILLLITMDELLSSGYTCKVVCDAVSKKYNLDPSAVNIASTHTHSAPDCFQTLCPSSERYLNLLIAQLQVVCDLAIADLTEATILTGRTQNEGLNYVRHYLMADGTVAGDNFGDYKNGTIVRSITEPDREIQLIKICRKDEKDILMVNWQAHPALASTSTTEHGKKHRPYASADYVGACRKYIEEKTDMFFAYFQGCCGNINSRSYNPADTVTKDHIEYGQQLAAYILKGLEHLQPMAGTRVQTTEQTFHGEVDHTEDHLLEPAKEIYARWEAENNYHECVAMGKPYGINSPYHALSIIRKVDMDKYLDMTLGAARVGDIGFAFIPYEPFDTNGRQIKDASPFAMTFALGYCNNYFNYVPSQMGFDYSCYERNQCKHAPGTGEAVAQDLVKMLEKLHKN